MNFSIMGRILLLGAGVLVAWLTIGYVHVHSYSMIEPHSVAKPWAMEGEYELVQQSLSAAIAPLIDARPGDRLRVYRDSRYVHFEPVSGDAFPKVVLIEQDNLFWRSDREAVFRQTPPPVGPEIFPGFGKIQREGWIRRGEDGMLSIESVWWERCLVFYLLPLHKEQRSLADWKPLRKP